MKTVSNDFDLLDKWALMSDVELQTVVSEETTRVLHRVAQSLVDAEQLKQLTIDTESFVPVVRMMRKLKREGSRALGDAIIHASDLLDNGEAEEAIAAYRHFCSGCSSPYYRNIALSQIRKISDISKDT